MVTTAGSTANTHQVRSISASLPCRASVWDHAVDSWRSNGGNAIRYEFEEVLQKK